MTSESSRELMSLGVGGKSWREYQSSHLGKLAVTLLNGQVKSV